ncbi:Peptidoglycan/LPS O-acetylase OafA/YrhL, contains acyltransferase and SGNH-hydrolase domains [Roseateles sp. YR242]|uniref:acyltransferase family protein n=1 Tax=Roseateles sp. YR242 TaxID=1855305 RepID=UPI0008C848AC|nr:acyltransferase family protein [Roseateles sp. YR242]SEK23265.1 Peptidoglycan/LPS O-acetylase OafA/YrhL, contains acyltransferase and SGNH-hydrolase domains [Roseateles sp. YR242]
MRQDSSAYRRDIDGLRCIAVLSVVAYHFGLSCPGGFTGVDIFFVISGYLIGSQIYSEASQGRFSYAAFYYRRARRIVPALMAVLIATGAAMLALASPLELRDFGRDAAGAVFSVSNITLYRAIDYFRPAAESNPLLMTWSLGVEEQFYIIAPVLLGLIVRLRPHKHFAAVAMLAAMSLSLAVWQVRHAPQAAFYLLPPRAWELAVGVLLAIWRVHHAAPLAQRRQWQVEVMAVIGLVLLIVPIATYSATTRFPGLAALPSVVGAALLLHADGSYINTRLLSHRFATFFGLVSYSLYLWHWPLISIARMTLEDEPSLGLRLGLMACSLALAYGSYRWIETPFRRAATPQRQALHRYAAVLAVAGLVAGSGYLLGGIPQRWAPDFAAMEANAQPPQNRCLVGYGGTTLPPAELCAGASEHQDGWALVGDSHASAMAPALQALSQSSGWRLVEFTKSSCPFLVGVTRPMARYPQHGQECVQFNEQVMDRLVSSPAIKVVVIGGFWGIGMAADGPYTAVAGAQTPPEAALRGGLMQTVQALKAAGKQVVVLGDVPFFNFAPIKRVAACSNRLRAQLNDIEPQSRDCEFGTWAQIADDARAHAVVRDVVQHAGATYIDPRASLCDGSGCRFADSGRMLYLDRQHLSTPGAHLAAQPLKSRLGFH